jgi:cell volume regulation protein A
VFELRLPAPTVVSLIIRRAGRALVPDRETVLLRGDEVLIVTTTPMREAAERRLRAVSRRGRLARWFGERGDPLPS